MMVQMCNRSTRIIQIRELLLCIILIVSCVGLDARAAGDFQIVEDDNYIQIWTPLGHLHGEKQKNAMNFLVDLIESKIEELHQNGKLPKALTRETLLAARKAQGSFDEAIEALTGKNSYGMGLLHKFVLDPGLVKQGMSPIPRALMGFISFGTRFGGSKILGVAMDFGVIMMGYHVTYIPKYQFEQLRQTLKINVKRVKTIEETSEDWNDQEGLMTQEDATKILDSVDHHEGIQEGWRLRWSITGWLGPQIGKTMWRTEPTPPFKEGGSIAIGAIWGDLVRPEEFHGVALSPAIAFPDVKLLGSWSPYLRLGCLLDDSNRLLGSNRFALFGIEHGSGKKIDLRFDFKFILSEALLVKYFKKLGSFTGTLVVDPYGNPRYE